MMLSGLGLENSEGRQTRAGMGAAGRWERQKFIVPGCSMKWLSWNDYRQGWGGKLGRQERVLENLHEAK